VKRFLHEPKLFDDLSLGDGGVPSSALPLFEKVGAQVVEAATVPVGEVVGFPAGVEEDGSAFCDLETVPTLSAMGTETPPLTGLWWNRRFIVVR
jgi:hypothetical protein